MELNIAPLAVRAVRARRGYRPQLHRTPAKLSVSVLAGARTWPPCSLGHPEMVNGRPLFPGNTDTDQLQKIFDHMNYRKLDRIDAMESTAAILICNDDTFDQLLHNVIFIFGFSAVSQLRTIALDELFFFLDCLFRTS